MKFKVGDLIRLTMDFGDITNILGIVLESDLSGIDVWRIKWLDTSVIISNLCHESNMEKVA
jgi:hypothetical protein